MVNGIGNSGGGIARDAIKAAMQRQSAALERLKDAAQELSGTTNEATVKEGFSSALTNNLRQVNEQIKQGDQIVDGLVTGKVTDFHQIAAQVKQADLSFKFALAVRNKFIDAYREVMRMSI